MDDTEDNIADWKDTRLLYFTLTLVLSHRGRGESCPLSPRGRELPSFVLSPPAGESQSEGDFTFTFTLTLVLSRQGRGEKDVQPGT